MYNETYLQHHGVLGMKWGVRRYQKPDGTLTNAGKRRYYVDENGKYHKVKGRTFHARAADKVSNNLELMSKERKDRMSLRQKLSYDASKRYWDARAKGQDTPHRGIIKQYADIVRSDNFETRAVKTAINSASSVLTNALRAEQYGSSISAGKIAASTAMSTVESMALDEFINKFFGHY